MNKLTRITKMRHRVFRDFAWPNDLHSFGQFNVIYGWNGCGKTTLSSLLSLVEKQTALTEGMVELEFDGVTKVTGAELGSKPVPQVRVFNRGFIDAALLSAGGIAPIYFLGEENVEKQRQVEKLKLDLAEATAALTKSNADRSDADRRLDEFCKDKAKVIKALLTTGNSTAYNNYDKRKFKLAVQALNAQSAAAAILSNEQKVLLRSQKDAQPKPTVERVTAPAVDLVALTQEVETLVKRSVVAETLDELKTDADLGAWVQRGLFLHAGAYASDTCRFCNQPFEATRRSALEAHFNDAFASLQNHLSAILMKLKSARQGLSSLRLPDTSRFYDALTPEVTAANEAISAALSATETALAALIARVEVKRDKPFAPVSEVLSSRPNSASIGHAIAILNTSIDQHNRVSAQFKASVDEACKKLEASFVAEEHAEYHQLAQASTDASAALNNLKGKVEAIQSRIDTLETQIREHHRAADELTDELRTYLGRDELRFEVKGNGYALTRNGQLVAHLSEGERTAIAFLYFLKSLKDKNFDMATGIVVIDDPVSSLDANALFSAFGYMKERTKKCGQLFIFTHSFPFFRLVKNWFHYLPGQRKKNVEDRPGRFFLLRSRRHTDGSRTSALGPLDPLLEQHESEYQYLFKRVYEEAHRTDVATLEHHYGLPNIARRLLEAFLAFRFPDMSGDLGPRVDRVVDRYGYDAAKKTRVLRLLNTYSHAEALMEPEHDLSLLAETQPVLRDLLDLMKAADKDHYEGMERLVAPPVLAAAAAPLSGEGILEAAS